MNYTENAPNAGRLIQSLRSSGYAPEQAIADLVDNAIDADASKIDITVSKEDGGVVIKIEDDGFGMNRETVEEALRLGSLIDKDVTSELGKFGMGMITASLALGRKLEVTTKEEGGPAYLGMQDVDVIVKENRFVKILNEISLEKTSWNKHGHGTIVQITKIDRLENQDIPTLAGTLKRELTRIFRVFLNGDKLVMTVNGDKLVPPPHLVMTYEGTEVFVDERFEVSMGGAKDHIRVRLGLLPPLSQQELKQMQLTEGTVGFSIFRNDREIAHAKTLRLFSKHHKFIRMIAEIYFPATLDEVMGVSFTKHEIRPSIAMQNKLEQVVKPHLSAITKKLTEHWNKAGSMGVNHQFAERQIQAKAKQLLTPTGFKERRTSPVRAETPKTGAKKAETGKRRESMTKGQRSLANYARFDHVTLGRSGPLFDCYTQGKTTVVEVNVNHPFFEEIYLKSEDKDVRLSIDYLLYSMAAAQLAVQTDENYGVLEDHRTFMSSNLRTLLS